MEDVDKKIHSNTETVKMLIGTKTSTTRMDKQIVLTMEHRISKDERTTVIWINMNDLKNIMFWGRSKLQKNLY